MQWELGREQGPADPDPQRGEVAGPTAAEIADEICRDLLAIHRESYGRSVASAQAHVLDDTVVVLLDGLELLPNEEFLISEGHEEAVAKSARSSRRRSSQPSAQRWSGPPAGR